MAYQIVQAAVGVGVAAGEVEDERLSAGQVVLIVEVEGGCGGVVAAVVEQFQGGSGEFGVVEAAVQFGLGRVEVLAAQSHVQHPVVRF